MRDTTHGRVLAATQLGLTEAPVIALSQETVPQPTSIQQAKLDAPRSAVVIGAFLAVKTQLAVFPIFGLEAALQEHLAIGPAFSSEYRSRVCICSGGRSSAGGGGDCVELRGEGLGERIWQHAGDLLGFANAPPLQPVRQAGRDERAR
jgi:hypothetical protein